MSHPLIALPQGAELLIILAIVILVFGAKKLPELARGSGQALRIFKTETKGLRTDEADESATALRISELPAGIDSTRTDSALGNGTQNLPSEHRP